MITDLNHVSVIVSDTEQALGFYRDLLGLKLDAGRPDLGYPGAWLIVGDASIHLLELPNPDATTDRPKHGGRDRHIAFDVSDLAALIDKLERADISYTLSRSGRRALFCRDYDGNALELIETV